MYSLTAYLAHTRAIARAAPAYVNGGLSRAKLDCVGLPMLAMKELGRADYPMHSSNYFYRYQVADLVQIDGEEDVFLGMTLFKTRGADESGYDLKYGTYINGRYDTGDYLDAYHVGVVTGVNPLEITECTSTGLASGIKITSSLGNPARGGWDCGGKLKGIDYENYNEEGDNTMVYDNGTQATVKTAAKGSTWNVRKAPSSNGTVLFTVPFGAEVTVYETADGWAQIEYEGERGYMVTDGLTIDEEETEDVGATDDAGNVTITITAAQAAAIKAVAALL